MQYSPQHIGKPYLLGAIVGVAPHLKQWFENILTKDVYSINELNALFRYQAIQLSPDNVEVRSWLCNAENIEYWIHYFCQKVIPFFSQHLSCYFSSPEQQLSYIGT